MLPNINKQRGGNTWNNKLEVEGGKRREASMQARTLSTSNYQTKQS